MYIYIYRKIAHLIIEFVIFESCFKLSKVTKAMTIRFYEENNQFQSTDTVMVNGFYTYINKKVLQCYTTDFTLVQK